MSRLEQHYSTHFQQHSPKIHRTYCLQPLLSLDTAELQPHGYSWLSVGFSTSKIVRNTCIGLTFFEKGMQVQNAEARLVTMVSKSDHITPILFKKLYWLPVKERVTSSCFLSPLKLCRMVKHHHTSVNSSNIYQPSRSLRSSSLKYMYLSVSKCNTAFYGYRAFSVASAKL